MLAHGGAADYVYCLTLIFGIMSKLEWVPWPIDNKHVLEDFTDVLHGGDCVERRHNGIVRQAFYDGAALWEISYRFGSAWFTMTYRGGPILKEYALDSMFERIRLLNDDNNHLSVIGGVGEDCIDCKFMKGIEL